MSVVPAIRGRCQPLESVAARLRPRCAPARETLVYPPGAPVGGPLNGIAFAPWRGRPTQQGQWETLIDPLLNEPSAAGCGRLAVAIVEPDNRVWMLRETRLFGAERLGLVQAWCDPELSLQAAALRAAWECTGLAVAISAWFGDMDTPDGRMRIYLAERIGGAPTLCGWDCATVLLMPPNAWREQAAQLAKHGDKAILAALETALAMRALETRGRQSAGG